MDKLKPLGRELTYKVEDEVTGNKGEKQRQSRMSHCNKDQDQ